MSESVAELFDRALDREPAQWREFVESQSDNEETRSALLELLRQVEDEVSASEPLLGSRYGPYRLLRKIGRGGSSSVYLAARVDGAFLRRVAVKVIPKRWSVSDRSLESQILASLEHEGIARLYDAGTSENGEAYLAMEYVDGVPLDDYCEREALDLSDRLTLFLEVCDAVAFAHRNLVVHRDLKPGNILVGQDGRAKLLDFGIARLFDPEVDDPTVTIGPRALTPSYASTEQLVGRPVTTLSDVFSLGAVLYRLVTGQDPFPRSLEDRLASLTTGQEPDLPSRVLSFARGGPVRRRDVDGDVDAIVTKALQPTATERYLSVRELADDIQRFMGGLPVRARLASPVDRAAKFVKRHRAAVLSAVTVLVALTTAVVGLARMNVRISQERAEAEEARVIAENATDFLLTTFASADPKVAQDGELTVREVLDEAVGTVGETIEEPQVRTALLNVIGRAYLSLSEFDVALEQLQSAREQQLELLGPDDLQTLSTQVALGSTLLATSKLGPAGELLEDSVRRLDALDHDDVALHVEALQALAVVHFRRRELDQAEVILERTLEIFEAHGVRSLPLQTVATVYHLRGNLLFLDGHLEEAVGAFDGAVTALTDAGGSERVELTGPLKELATVHLELGDVGLAETLLDRVIEIERRAFPDGHLKIPFTLDRLSRVYLRQGRFDEATQAAEESHDMRVAMFGEHPSMASSLAARARIHLEQGQLEEAARLFEGAVAVRTRARGADDPVLSRHHRDLALAARLRGDYEAAENHLDEAARLCRDVPRGGLERFRVGLERARLLAARGERPAAETQLQGLRQGLEPSQRRLRSFVEEELSKLEGP